LLQRKKYSRATVFTQQLADIAKEADLAYGSVYQYFDSKDDLFHALMSAEGYALRTHVAVTSWLLRRGWWPSP
jgi:hypothetical protein